MRRRAAAVTAVVAMMLSAGACASTPDRSESRGTAHPAATPATNPPSPSASAPVNSAPVNPKRPVIPAHGAEVGSFLSILGKSRQESRELREKQLGRDDAIISLYFRWTDALPDHFSNLPRARHR